MKFKLFKWVWGLIIISLIGTAIVFPKLPQQIPIHWNINGVADNYANKVFAFFTALLPLLFYLLYFLIPKIDPKKESYQKHQKAYEICSNLSIVLFIAIHWVSLIISLGAKINVTMLISIAAGILFVVIGNYMSQIRHNYFFGIRTPWTLANETVWNKTHRVGGFLFVTGGIIFAAGGLINSQYGFWIAIVYLLVMVIYLFVYSYFVFRQIQKNQQQ